MVASKGARVGRFGGSARGKGAVWKATEAGGRGEMGKDRVCGAI